MPCRFRAFSCLVGALCGIVLAFTLHPSARVASAAGDEEDTETCVRPIADVTGDGVADLAVSRSTPRTGTVMASLIAGPYDPSTLLLDPGYIRQHRIAELRGPAAMPFLCGPQPEIDTAAVASAAARRPSPATTTVLDAPVSYRLVDLDALAPRGLTVGAGLNAAGHVVGNFVTADGLDHAFFYDGTSLRDLGTLGGSHSYAQGINRRGDIVGVSLTGASDNFGAIHSAFLFDGQLRSLARDWSAARAINDARQIVGEMLVTPGVDLLHAFVFDNGSFTDLGSLPPLATTAYSSAHAINDAGWVVGESNTYTVGSTRRHAAVRGFFWADGVLQDLGSLGVPCVPYMTDERCYERSVATDLNKAGTIVGFSTTATNIRGHAFVSHGKALEDLGALGGSASWAYGINDSGQIVGGFSNVGDSYSAPFLYDRGTMHDLNQLVINPSDARAMPFTAYGINNFGQILGNHHVLHPVYDQVEPGVDFQFDARLRRTLTFAYWVSRGAGGECRARRSRLYLEVKFQRIGGRHDEWTPADVVRACEDATDWQDVSIPIPRRAWGDRGVVHVRVREVGPRTDPTVYLRHFSME